jgi:lipoate-protein ligase B
VWSPDPLPWGEAQRQQDEWAGQVARGADGILWLLRHPPTITIGRSGGESDLCVPAQELTQRGVELCRARRGGRTTFHGPGQLIAYPVLDLRRHRRDIHWYLRRLEHVVISALAAFGIEAGRREGQTGVWVGQSKVASIGVRLRRWITADGLALNVGSDLSGFDLIRPCGMEAAAMTSVSRLAAREVEPGELVEPIAAAFAQELGGGTPPPAQQ